MPVACDSPRVLEGNSRRDGTALRIELAPAGGKRSTAQTAVRCPRWGVSRAPYLPMYGHGLWRYRFWFLLGLGDGWAGRCFDASHLAAPVSSWLAPALSRSPQNAKIRPAMRLNRAYCGWSHRIHGSAWRYRMQGEDQGRLHILGRTLNSCICYMLLYENERRLSGVHGCGTRILFVCRRSSGQGSLSFLGQRLDLFQPGSIMDILLGNTSSGQRRPYSHEGPGGEAVIRRRRSLATLLASSKVTAVPPVCIYP